MPRRILLAATGLTPQVVTETLYTLVTAPMEQRFVPDEVHAVTTTEGANSLRRLFETEEAANPLAALCREYGVPRPKLEVHVLSGPEGPLADLRNVADNDAAADGILHVVRELTADADTAVHFSIAGGRKTMGYLLGACASLLGRTQDRMSHVLVGEPFESAPGFFYTTKPDPPRYVYARGELHDASRARIELAPVAFIRLRSLLPEPLIERGSFTTIVRVVDHMLGDPRLTLRVEPVEGKRTARGVVEIGGGLAFELPAKSFAYYWLLASQARREQPWVRARMDAATLRRDYLGIYRLLAGVGARLDTEEENLRDKGHLMDTDYRNAMARLGDDLKKRLGEPATRVYGPHGEGRGTELRHRLLLRPEAIELVLARQP